MISRSRLDTDFFSAPPDLSHSFCATKQLVSHEAICCSIESLTTLGTLLAEKRAKKEPPILRFLVDHSCTAWFAKETFPGIKAPKHFQMTGKLQENAYCQTAGNIKFKNSKCTVLRSINHKSGDFHPSFHSLRSFLALLILNEDIHPFKLPKVLIVKELNNNGTTLKKHKWPVTQIKKWVTTFHDEKQLISVLMQKNIAAKTVEYPAFTIPDLKEQKIIKSLPTPKKRLSLTRFLRTYWIRSKNTL